MKSAVFNIDREYNCDVLVCGGGISGFASAVASARQGADTILIESGGFLGGTATKGLVGPFMTCYDAKGQTQIIRGIFEQLVERLVKEGGAISHKECRGGDSYSGYRIAGHTGVTPFESEVLKSVMEKMCIEAGVKLIYHTSVIACDTADRKITEVFCATPESIISISANVYIDTTGTASLVNKAGNATVRGDENGFLQTSSLFFTITGVNKEALDKHMSENPEMNERFYMNVIEKGQADGSFPCGTMKLRIYEKPDGDWTVNMAQVDDGFCELDCDEVTAAEISQREQIQKIFKFLKNNIPPLKDIRMITSASDIGVRESRRMVGKSVLTLEDIQSAKKFDDRIAVCANSVDIHQKKGVAYTAHTNKNYYIPLSCLIARDIDNLLTAGKSLSADKFAFAAVRVMPPCAAMGEAAGITAALAAINGINVPSVDITEVQKILRKNGAYLD